MFLYEKSPSTETPSFICHTTHQLFLYLCWPLVFNRKRSGGGQCRWTFFGGFDIPQKSCSPFLRPHSRRALIWGMLCLENRGIRHCQYFCRAAHVATVIKSYTLSGASWMCWCETRPSHSVRLTFSNPVAVRLVPADCFSWKAFDCGLPPLTQPTSSEAFTVK